MTKNKLSKESMKENLERENKQLCGSSDMKGTKQLFDEITDAEKV